MSFRMAFLAATVTALSACGGTVVDPGGPTIDDPYQSCDPADDCTQGTTCLETTLPASAGFTGSLCTVTCNTSDDCPQDLSNFAAICVNSQCYTQCPDGGGSCPYGTGCVTFSDQNGNPFNLCTP